MPATALKDDAASKEERARLKNAADAATGVKCELDGEWVHSIFVHLKYSHPTVTLAQYQARFPKAEIESPFIKKLRADKEAELAASAPTEMKATVTPFPVPTGGVLKPLHQLFGMKASKAFENAEGKQVHAPVLGAPDDEIAMFLPEIDDNYVFEAEELREVNMAIILNLPMLLWGMHGTGKTTIIEQFLARTNRPWIRVQHTVDTEGAQIIGQYVIKADPVAGKNVMVFEPGPLAIAMRYGLVYCGDEYDFGLPSVTALYQPVLEGKALLIKEAPPEWRIVKPHPNFRFFATGNTNGSGDETGLYQGTQLMNAANYSRFGVTMKVEYRKPDIETQVVSKQGGITVDHARKLVNFATKVRELYEKGEISVTCSTRELINAAKIGMVKGLKFREGLRSAYMNRLGTTDRKAVDDAAQRMFGEA